MPRYRGYHYKTSSFSVTEKIPVIKNTVSTLEKCLTKGTREGLRRAVEVIENLQYELEEIKERLGD